MSRQFNLYGSIKRCSICNATNHPDVAGDYLENHYYGDQAYLDDPSGPGWICAQCNYVINATQDSYGEDPEDIDTFSQDPDYDIDNLGLDFSDDDWE